MAIPGILSPSKTLDGAPPASLERRRGAQDLLLAAVRFPPVWAWPAAITLGHCLLGIQRAVLWQDELATVSAATRSLPDLVRLCTHVDGVHAAYYLVMHFWTVLFGTSPLAVRLPSALAMATAGGITAVLGERLFNRRAGLLAGLILACSPPVSWIGQEARPYALTFLLVAVSTLLLLGAINRPRSRRWVQYGLSLVALGTTQLTATVLIGAHGCAVASVWLGHRDSRLRGWVAASGAALIVLAPLGCLAWLQRAQVGWIPEITWHSVGALPGQLFAAPVIAGIVIGVALLGAFRSGAATVLCLATALLPVVVLALVSPGLPLLLPRYLVFTVLGWVLLAGSTLSRFGRREAAAVLIGIVTLGLPAQVQLRSTIKYNRPLTPDYRTIARIMEHEIHPGDAIIVPTAEGIRFRTGLRVYLPAGDWPRDPLATGSPADAATLDAPECVPATCLGSPARIWVGCVGACTDPLASIRPETASMMHRRGYVAERVWHVEKGAITLYSLPSHRT